MTPQEALSLIGDAHEDFQHRLPPNYYEAVTVLRELVDVSAALRAEFADPLSVDLGDMLSAETMTRFERVVDGAAGGDDRATNPAAAAE